MVDYETVYADMENSRLVATMSQAEAIESLRKLGYTVIEPKTISRSMKTPDRLAKEIHERRMALGMSLEGISQMTGADVEEVAIMEHMGLGSTADALKILKVLGIRPIKLPHPLAMRDRENGHEG